MSICAPRPRLLRAAMLAAVLATFGGCSEPAPPRDATAAAIASIDARLRGSFRLVSFVPEIPLEPMLAVMLQAQYGTLVIRFDGRQLTADSPGVHVVRTYEIREPQGDRFTLVAFDESGVPYDSVCEFSGADQLVVYAQTPPWKGVATIRRAAP